MIIYTATSIPADKPSPFLLLENEVLYPRAQKEQGAAEGASGGLLGFCSQAQALGFPSLLSLSPVPFLHPISTQSCVPRKQKGILRFLEHHFHAGRRDAAIFVCRLVPGEFVS